MIRYHNHMDMQHKIRKVLREHPHWGPARIAEEIGTSAKTISVTGSKHKIKFLNTREIEDMVDRLLDGKA